MLTRREPLHSLAFDQVQFALQLRDPLELNIEIAAHLFETRAVIVQRGAILFEDLTTLVEDVDHAIEFGPRHGGSSGFRDTGDRPQPAGSRRHSALRVLESPTYPTAESAPRQGWPRVVVRSMWSAPACDRGRLGPCVP